MKFLLTKRETHKAGSTERREDENWEDYQSRRELKIAEAELRLIAGWIKREDTYSQYTGQDHKHLVRRLDIPNKDIDQLYRLAGLPTV